MKKRKRRTGFTRTELMVVGGCLTLFTFILLPGLTGAREAGKRAICLSNLKTLGAGMLLYAQDYEGKIPAWGWQFDEIGRYGTGSWSNPDNDQLTKFVEWGYIWEYIQNKRPYVCPSLSLNHNPRYLIPSGLHSNYVWGWPDPTNPAKPGPMWSYQLNAQAAYSQYTDFNQWRIKPELVLPNPENVMMLFEQDYRDYASFDNGISLFEATHQQKIDQDTVGPYHMVSGIFQETGPTFAGGTRTMNRIQGNGNIVYFDGHVGDMTSEEFREKRSTAEGTLELIGGYFGFTWPGY